MVEFKDDNDYSVTVFGKQGFLVKAQYVNSLGSLVLWLNKSDNYRDWTTINVYVRRSRRFLGQWRNGQFIPSKPR